MNKLRPPSRLGLKFVGIAALAFAAALALQALLYDSLLPAFLQSPQFESYWYARYGDAADRFQSYVTARQLTVQQAKADTHWTRQNPQVDLYLESPVFLEPELLNDGEEAVVQCADGVLYAFPFPAYLYYDGVCRVVSISLASLCFVLALTPYTVHLIRRITRLSRDMQVLAGGDLDHQVVSRGRDELAELGRSIEEMRCAVLEQIQRENEAVLANSRLITSLSHDLRTPLTKLMGYLEILQHGKYRDEEERAAYLKMAGDKAEQMRTLSDEMFRHFQVERTFPREPEAELVDGPVFLGQLLAELSFDLESAGFSIQPPAAEGEFQLQVRVEDICRVFDNLFSNLKKYADPGHPILLRVEERDRWAVVRLENRLGPSRPADSRGIGLPTIRALLERNGGHMDIQRDGDRYRAGIWLPKHREEAPG